MWAALALFVVIAFTVVAALRRAAETVCDSLLWHPITTEKMCSISDISIQSAQIKSADGAANIQIFLSHTIDPELPWLIYCHGMLTDCFTERELFAQLQGIVNLVMWEYRGFGEKSDAQARMQSAECDLHFVLAALATNYNVAPKDVILMGRSLGCNLILNYVKNRRQSPQRLILCHPFFSPASVLRHLNAPSPMQWLLGNYHSTHGHLAAYVEQHVDAKILVLASSDDTVAPYSEVIAECEAAVGNVTLIDIGGSHFSQFDAGTTLWTTVKRHLIEFI